MKPLKNVDILIVEDDEDNLEFLRRLMLKFGANAIIAQSGEEAIECVKKNDKIKIVLMDIRLPYMDGFEATQQIKALKPSLPVIAQTAYAMYNDKELCLQNGCDDYVSKPLDKDILFQKINQYIYN
ncbi:response regulator [Bacteroidota bacterium]